jgi:hypothetical protein
MSTEAIGYVASALVVLSLTMTSVVRLRSISLIGSVTFVVYGVLIESVPIVITNTAIAAINVWFLRNELGLRRDLGASPIPADAPFLVDFIEFHRAEITRFQPDFRMPVRNPFALLLTRDGLPAGAVLGERQGAELHIAADHVLAPYRDSRLGIWLYGRGVGVFRAAGFERLVSEPGDDTHCAYLERVGFRREADQYVLDV